MRDLVEGKRGQGEEGEGSSSACGPMVRVGALRDHFVSGLFHHRAPGGCTSMLHMSCHMDRLELFSWHFMLEVDPLPYERGLVGKENL